MVALRLFGCLTKIFLASESCGYGLELLDGQVVICDTVRKAVRLQDYCPDFLAFAAGHQVLILGSLLADLLRADGAEITTSQRSEVELCAVASDGSRILIEYHDTADVTEAATTSRTEGSWTDEMRK